MSKHTFGDLELEINDVYPRPVWQLKDKVGRFVVSTVKLPIDHNLTGNKPIWYETMVFEYVGPEIDDCDYSGVNSLGQTRYHTQEEAEAGHKQVCEEARVLDEEMDRP